MSDSASDPMSKQYADIYVQKVMTNNSVSIPVEVHAEMHLERPVSNFNNWHKTHEI